MICPSCKGQKVLRGIGCPMDGTGCRPIEIECDLCGCTGEITDQQNEWRARGQEHRRQRLERGFALSAEAKRRGISCHDLSRMERGIADPSPLFVKEGSREEGA